MVKAKSPEMKNGIHGSVNGSWIFFEECMARKLLLLRHGDTGLQYRNRYIGGMDVPMSPHGHQQIKAVGVLLGREEFSQCLCSPSQRCRETAALITEPRGMGFSIDPDLREIDFGQWEGMTFDEIGRLFPDRVDTWANLDADFTFPGGEKIADFQARIVRVANSLAANPADTVLVCTHGGVIRFLICHFLGLQTWQYILFQVKHASVTTIEIFNGSGILAGLNEAGQTE